MKALVTGGGGFLGLYLVEQLLARGDDVRVFCRGHYDALETLGVETVRGDIRDADAVKSACVDRDTIFHAAAVPGVWGPEKLYRSINTTGTENVIAGCRHHNVRRLVYTSSPSVIYDGCAHENADESLPYPDSYLCHYPASKAAAERAVLAANDNALATCALRPHLIWGPRDNHLIPRLIQRAQSGRLRRVGDGTNLISMSYVENTAAAHLMAADRLDVGTVVAGKAYFINEPDAVNLWEWIDQLLALGDLPPIRKSISASAAWRIGRVMESVWTLLRLPGEPPMTRFVAQQLSSSHYYNTARARRDFDFSPMVVFEEAMRRLAPTIRELAGKRA